MRDGVYKQLLINVSLSVPTAQPQLKVEGDQGLGPNTGALAPHTRSKAGAACWVLEEVAPSHCEGPGYHPRKNFENSDAKSCILVTLAVKCLAF